MTDEPVYHATQGESRVLSPTEVATKDQQDKFITAFQAGGTILAGSKATGVTRATVHRWMRDNHLGFAERYQAAHEAFVDSLEDVLADVAKHGDVSALKLALTANRPDKYNPKVVIQDDSAREILRELRQLGRGEQVGEGEEEG